MKDIRNQSNNASVQSNSVSVQSNSAELQCNRAGVQENSRPALRFNGFSEEWKVRKLGEIGKTYTGLSGKTKEDFGHGQACFVTYMNVYLNPISCLELTEPIEIDNKQNEVEVGDIFFTTSSETPDEVGMSSVLLEKKGKTYLNSFCFGYRPFKKNDNYYLAYMLRSEVVRKKFILLAQGISRYNISKNKVMELSVPFPSLPEQSRIGTFFRSLDDLIALRTRKLEKLRNVKKAFLEKMFVGQSNSASEQECCSTETQNHRTTDYRPSIRFKGFTEEWEVRKLGEYLEVSTEKNADGIYSKNDVLSVSGDFGIVNQIEFQGRSFAGVSVLNYGIVHTGDVVYTKSPLKANPYGIIKSNKGETGIVSVLYGVYHPKGNANSDFVQIYFEQDARLNNYLCPLVNKGAKNTLLISDSVALKGNVLFASSYSEQSRIGAFFKTLDHLIALQEKELTKLRNIKQACLGRMFV